MFKFVILPQSRSLPGLVVACCLLAGCNSAELPDTDGDSTAAETPSTEQPVDPESPASPETPVDPEPGPETDADPDAETDAETAAEPEPPVGDCVVSGNSSDSEGSVLELPLTNLQAHLDGTATLTNEQIEEVTDTLELHAEQLSDSPSLIELAFDTIDLYDEVFGPLFLNEYTAARVPREPPDASSAIHYAMIALQQSVLDHAYADRNVRRYQSTLDNRGFATAGFFPGPVANDSAPTSAYTVAINASNNPSLTHRPYGAFDADSRRPTGAYAAPGAIVEVRVPEALVGRGYKVRVGAHTWDLSNKNTITRLDRISLSWDILCTQTLVSNPLGGGIYIEVPFEADAGVVDVQIDNAVRSPFFAARNFTAHTSANEWAVEKTHTAPWTDLEGEHFMIQVPTAWLDEIEDPAVLMDQWDNAMQSILDLYGITETHKTMLYVQIDRILRGSANFPGYPMSNFSYNPATPNPNNGAKAFLRGPDDVNYVTFHELGHQLFFTKFRGEVESVVHLPYVNFMNRVFNVDLDTAFSQSSFRNPNVNLDQAFMNWAVRPNFQQGLPMRTERPNSEKLYQRRGYAHYIEIVALFGWEALERFWASEHTDYAAGTDYDRNSNGDGDVDSRILRMSRAAGFDLTPLLHTWGNHPEYPEELSAAIQSEGLPASAQIYDRLQYYKTLIPMTREAFTDHARTIYPLLQRNTNTEAFEGWYHETEQTWSASDGDASQLALQNIIDRYFPAGRPLEANTTAITLPDNADPSNTEPSNTEPSNTEPSINSATQATPLPVTVIEDIIDFDHHLTP